MVNTMRSILKDCQLYLNFEKIITSLIISFRNNSTFVRSCNVQINRDIKINDQLHMVMEQIDLSCTPGRMDFIYANYCKFYLIAKHAMKHLTNTGLFLA